MAEGYTELFRQLYQHKFYDLQMPTNSIERVRLLQRKIKENKNIAKIPIKEKNVFVNEALNGSQNYLDGPSSKIIRFYHPKQQQFKTNKPSTAQNQHEENNSHQSLGGRKNMRRKSYSYQKNRAVINNGFNASKKFSLVKTEKIHNFTLDLKSKQKGSLERIKFNPQKLSTFEHDSNLRTYSRQKQYRRVSTPSKQVYIGGKNLEEEAQSHRIKIRMFDKEVQNHNKQLKLNEREQASSFSRRKKTTTRYDKYRIQIKKNSISQGTHRTKPLTREAGRSERVPLRPNSSQREQNIELLPWSMLPEHQFY